MYFGKLMIGAAFTELQVGSFKLESIESFQILDAQKTPANVANSESSNESLVVCYQKFITICPKTSFHNPGWQNAF